MLVVEPMRLLYVADSYDVLRAIDARPGQKDIVLDLSSNTALNMILAQVCTLSYVISLNELLILASIPVSEH